MSRRTSEDKKLRLTKKDMVFLDLYMSGMPKNEAGREAGLPRRRPDILLDDADFQAQMDKYTARVFAPMEGKATRVLAELLDSDNPWVKLQAVRLVFDQVNARSRGQQTTNITLAFMPEPGMPEPTPPEALPETTPISTEGAVA